MAPALTYDALLHVLALSDSLATAVSLMATCRLLYHEGARLVLEKPVKLKTNGQITSFLAFLKARDGARSRYLRRLHLDIKIRRDSTSSEVITGLASAIRETDNLETLELENTEPMLVHYPNLREALTTLTSLKNLTLLRAGPATRPLLESLLSQLVCLRVEWVFSSNQVFTDPSYLHPVPMLKRFADTLEQLDWETGDRLADESCLYVAYPKLRRLAIKCGDEGPLAVLPCIRAFPNTTHLSIVGRHAIDTLRPFVLERTAPARAGNDMWTNVIELQGSVQDLFEISESASHIPRLVLHQTDSTGMQWSLPRDVLARTRPSHLTYRTWGAQFLHEVRALCAIEAGKDALTHLELDIGIMEPDDLNIDFGRAMRYLTNWLFTIPRLQRLKLVIFMYDIRYGAQPQSGPTCWHEWAGCSQQCNMHERRWRPHFSRVEQEIEEIDLGSLAGSPCLVHGADVSAARSSRVVASLPRRYT